MDLDGIEPRVDGEAGRVGMGGDDVVDVVTRGPLGEAHGDRVEEPHGCERLGLIGPRVGDRPGVADLRADRRTFCVDRVGEPAQPRDGLGPHPDLPSFGAPTRRNRAIGDGRHPDAAGGR